MRTRLPLALLLSGALVLSACGGGGDEASGDATATDTPTAAATDGASSDATASEPSAQADLVSEDLPEGVAATVGDEEVPVDQLEARLEVIREVPQVQQQLESDQADQVEAQLQAGTLTQLIFEQAVIQGAVEEDVEITDQQVQERRSELAEQAGGAEALTEQLATAGGVPEGQIDQEIRFRLTAEALTERLLDDAGVEATTSPSEGSTATAPAPNPEAQQVQQEWLAELIADTEIVVDEAYGAWNPAAGQVVAA